MQPLMHDDSLIDIFFTFMENIKYEGNLFR